MRIERYSPCTPAMGIKIYLSTLDRPVDPEAATVSVLDRGFLYGDSVYETLRTVGGSPLERTRHLERLAASAQGIGMSLPFAFATIDGAVNRTLAAAENPESVVRIVVTRGRGRPLVLDPRQAADPLLVVYVIPLALPSARDYEQGVAVAIVGAQKTGLSLLDPSVKSGNYLGSVLALQQAHAQHAEDAVLCGPDGTIAEGASSNVFLVSHGTLVTPHLATGLLAGITRQVVCELAGELGLPLEERRIAPDELREADEAFLTSSVRGIMAVTRVDGRRLSDGRRGPVTSRIFARYQAFLEAAARAPSGT